MCRSCDALGTALAEDCAVASFARLTVIPFRDKQSTLGYSSFGTKSNEVAQAWSMIDPRRARGHPDQPGGDAGQLQHPFWPMMCEPAKQFADA